MKNQLLLVLCSCPSKEVAENISRILVEQRLAACVSTVPDIRSLFSWKGQVETAQESLLLIKTTETAYPELEVAIKLHHPYEIAEIIALPVHGGAIEYLEWVQESTCKN